MRGKRLSIGLRAVLAILSATLFMMSTWATAQETVLHNFDYNYTDGAFPSAGLISDASGNLYGTTSQGGTYGGVYCGLGCGTVFELSPAAGGGWTEKVLYSFSGYPTSDGSSPQASLISDAAGNLYGTTGSGGTYDLGTVFELSPAVGGGWTERVLYSFTHNLPDGAFPSAGLIFDGAGNLYGTTTDGGTHGGGTVFEMTPTGGGAWTETVLHSFCSETNCTDGYLPDAGLIFDGAGNLYGTTVNGGIYGPCPFLFGCGTVFEMTSTAGWWTYQVLWSFGNGTDGTLPAASLILDAAGNLYGTTHFGGIYGDCGGGPGCGTVRSS